MCAPHHPKAGGLTEWWNGLLKTTAPARWQCLAGLRQGFPESYMCPESSNTRCCFSHSPDCWIKGWKWEWHHLLFCPVTSTCKNCSFCSHDFIISWLRSLSSKGGNTSTRKYSNNSTELEVKTATQKLRTLHASEWTEKKTITVLAEVINPDYKGQIGLLFCHGGKEEYMWNMADPLGHLSITMPCD